MEESRYLAFDLGAESGRAVVGAIRGDRLRLQDVHRFPNGPVRILGTLYWDALRLFAECSRGLSMACEGGAPLSGIGIDTWGVDFGLLGRGDELLSSPRHYRDRGNDGMLEEAFRRVPPDEIYARTGIQFMQLNSLYQLLGLKLRRSAALESAKTLLFMADLLNFWFTGVKRTEFTLATTGQMVDPATGGWATDLLDRLNLPSHILTPISAPCQAVGPVLPEIASECGCGAATLYAPGEHDTASAVAAVPAEGSDWAYLSSGTWSLIGIETGRPTITPATRKANFTNEGGVCGTIRLLRNVMGLWLVQETRRSLTRRGKSFSYAELAELAEGAPPLTALFDPDHPSLLAPDDMIEAIQALCASTGQPRPDAPGAIVRACLESLALKYRWVLERLEEVRGQPISVVHMVGGGIQNRLLCRLASEASGRRVVAGPVEATAAGNVLAQAMARGEIGSLAEARALVRRSFELETYEPTDSGLDWSSAYQRFLSFMS